MADPDRAAELTIANERLQQELAERMRAEQEAALLARELSALHTATLALLSTLDLETLLGQILDAAASALPAAEKGILYLIAPETGALELRAVIGYTDPRIRKFSIPGARGFVARAVRERTPQLVDNVQTDPLIRVNGAIPEVRAIQSAIAAPLILDGNVLGALSLDSSRRKAFKPADLRLLVGFAAVATAALHNAQLHAEVQKLALTDSLTGLYNRRGFLELGRREVERARRFGRPLTAILIDADGFKAINDRHGHAAGDAVLRELAARFCSSIREVDILSRYGGDEFAVLLPETDLFTGSNVAERLRLSVEGAPFNFDVPLPCNAGNGDAGASPKPASPTRAFWSARLTISLGVARAVPQTPDLANLLDRADAAMYQAKEAGRNRVVVG